MWIKCEDERKYERYMGNQNPEKKRRKNSMKKNGLRIYAAVVLLLAAAILIIGMILLFYVRKIEVVGNKYSDSQEITASVQNDKLSVNSLYVLAKYSFGRGQKPECLDAMQVSLENPWTLKVRVKEKTIVGCVKSGKTYSYFDREGLVVREDTVKDNKIPVVEGMKITKSGLYTQIRTSNQTKFTEILEACEESQKYEIYPEQIYVKNEQIYMSFGNVNACLGNQVSAEQIAQIRPILKKLGDKKGILHLETYSENNTTITFEMEEISQEN